MATPFTPTSATPLSLIDAHSEFLSLPSAFAQSVSSLPPASARYVVLCVAGPQSSGKSTFLNALFGTHFRTLDPRRDGYKRTTVGLQLGVVHEPSELRLPFLVLDCEGSDSAQRGETDANFERQLALFALGVSHVLIVNLWAHDASRWAGSGAGLFRRVVEVAFRAFEPQRKTLLVFLVRDTPRNAPAEALREALLENWERVWAGSHQEVSWQRFFELETVLLPSFVESKPEFTEAVANFRLGLQNRLIKSAAAQEQDALFQCAVPVRDLFGFWRKLWARVLENKDLNLPTERKMVAIARCKSISTERREAVFPLLVQTLQKLGATAGGELDTLREVWEPLLKQLFGKYGEEALVYDRDIAREFETTLFGECTGLLAPLLEERLVGTCLNKLATTLEIEDSSVRHLDSPEKTSLLKAHLRSRKHMAIHAHSVRIGKPCNGDLGAYLPEFQTIGMSNTFTFADEDLVEIRRCITGFQTVFPSKVIPSCGEYRNALSKKIRLNSGHYATTNIGLANSLLESPAATDFSALKETFLAAGFDTLELNALKEGFLWGFLVEPQKIQEMTNKAFHSFVKKMNEQQLQAAEHFVHTLIEDCLLFKLVRGWLQAGFLDVWERTAALLAVSEELGDQIFRELTDPLFSSAHHLGADSENVHHVDCTDQTHGDFSSDSETMRSHFGNFKNHFAKKTRAFIVQYAKDQVPDRYVSLFETELLFDGDDLPIHFRNIPSFRIAFRDAREMLEKRIALFRPVVSEDTFARVMETARRHAASRAVEMERFLSVQQTNFKIPIVFWVVLLLFARKEVFWLVKRPLTVILLFLIAGLVFGLFKINQFSRVFHNGFISKAQTIITLLFSGSKDDDGDKRDKKKTT